MQENKSVYQMAMAQSNFFKLKGAHVCKMGIFSENVTSKHGTSVAMRHHLSLTIPPPFYIVFNQFRFCGCFTFFSPVSLKGLHIHTRILKHEICFCKYTGSILKKEKTILKKTPKKKTIHTKNPKIHIQEKHRMQQSFFSDFLTELWLFWSWAPDMSSKKKTYRFIAWHKGNMSLCMRNASEILIFTVYTYCKLKGNKQNGHQNNTMGTHKT